MTLIFWDIDGTLMHCGSDGTQALNRTFREMYGVEDAFRRAGIGRAQDSVVLKRIMEQHGIDPDDLLMIKSRFVENLRMILDGDHAKKVLPGVRKLLRCADENGIVNSLLTSNLRAGAECKLQSVNLLTATEGRLQFVGGGFGDAYGEKWDIAEQARREMEQILGRAIPADEVVLIGDSVYDTETAKRCGYCSVSVATGWTPADELKAADPDLLFDNLSDTDAVICAIEHTLNTKLNNA
jgi:phosphoglycolate phosphatase-like HAD superfamily hydrolase